MPSAIHRIFWSKTIPLVWCIVIPTALIFGGAWLIISILSGKENVKILGETAVPDHGNFKLGQTSDSKSGYKLWAAFGDSAWVNIGWSQNGGEDAIPAHSKSGRFHGIAAEGILKNEEFDLHDAPIVVIFDSQRGVLWPSIQAGENPSSFWLNAWREIRENEPRFPTPSFSEE